MGNVISDMVGIEPASEKLSNALVAAEANATGVLRNVALTGINYIKSFTPLITLIMVFLILLLLVGILSILARTLQDLGISQTIRRRILLVITVLLYISFLGVQIAAAVIQKGLTIIIVAIMASLGLVIIIGLSIWLIFRKPNSTESYSNLDEKIGIDPLRNQQTFGSHGTSSDYSIGRDERIPRPINGVD